MTASVPNLRILLLEDNEDDETLLLRHFKKSGCNVSHQRVDTAEEMKACLETQEWDIIISDYQMPSFDAPSAIKILKSTGIDLPFIIVSGTIGEAAAVESLRAGANDFILKGKLERLIPAIERELREALNRKRLKQSEDQLRQAQKMEAVGQLAGGIAHDYNNVLAVILMVCDRLLSTAESGSHLERGLEQIKKAGDRAALLTKQLLAFSRKQALSPRVLDLNTVTLAMQKMLVHLLDSNIELSSDLDPHLNHVRVDPGQLEQVIMNLAVNARDAMPKGGKLTLSTLNLKVQFPDPIHPNVPSGEYVVLSVADTGHGIDRKTLSKIFEPFFTTKGPNQGTGLGLSTVFGIVSQSKGFVGVQSELGKGTTFKIYFPKVDLPVDPLTDPILNASPEKQGKRSGTILLLEDQEDFREVLSKVLEELGYTVVKPASSGDAIAHVQSSGIPIHLLITDVMMPHLSGPEVAEKLLSIHPDIKILMMSGYLDEGIERPKSIESKSTFLQKPFTMSQFLTAVNSLMSHVTHS